MRFSQTTTKDAIVQSITFLTGLDTNAVDTKERARLATRWYEKLALMAWKLDPDWQFDDANIATGQTDNSWTYDATFAGLPRATTTMTDNVRIYRLPTNAFSIERVEILRSDGNWYVVDPIRESDIPRYDTPETGAAQFAVSEFYKTKSIPRFYNLIGANIELFPAPDSSQVTVASGLKIYVSRQVRRFVSTDSSVEPSLPEQFHELIALGAAFDIALAKGLQNAKILKQEIDEGIVQMQDYYVNRTRYNKRSIRPPKKSFI